MALGSTQPLTEMSTKLFPGDKGGRCLGLKSLLPSCAVVMKSGNLNFREPSGPLRGPGGVAGIETAYGLDGPRIESLWGRDFPHLSRPALRPTQPHVQWVPGLSVGGKVRPGRDTDPSPPSSAELKNRVELYL